MSKLNSNITMWLKQSGMGGHGGIYLTHGRDIHSDLLHGATTPVGQGLRLSRIHDHTETYYSR
jgi:hypothetical protein